MTNRAIVNYARSDEMVQRFSEIVGNSRNAMAYISSVLIAVAANNKLQECSPQSIMVSAMRAATLRLSCDPSLGQAHLVPFKDKATLVVGYKGLKDMAIRTGRYRYLNVATVFEGQEVVEDQLKGIHSIEGLRNPGSKPIGYMLYFELMDGYSKTFYMTVDEIMDHGKKYSKSFSFSDSPWKTHTEAMMKKTVLRLGLTKWGYFDPIDAMALRTNDDENEAEAYPEEQDDYIDGETTMSGEFTDAPVEEPVRDLAWAENYLTPNGTRYGDLNDSQLESIVETAKSRPNDPKSADMLLAADMIIGERIEASKSFEAEQDEIPF